MSGAPTKEPTCLADAVAAAQAEMRDPPRDRENPHFKSKFASLASILQSVRAPLGRCGVAIYQRAEVHEGQVSVETALVWRGEREASTLTAAPRDLTPQSIGSTITYLRRYGLAAMAGVAPDDDDDGESASKSEQRPAQQRPEPPRAPPPTQTADDWQRRKESASRRVTAARTALTAAGVSAARLTELTGRPANAVQLEQSADRLEEEVRALKRGTDPAHDSAGDTPWDPAPMGGGEP